MVTKGTVTKFDVTGQAARPVAADRQAGGSARLVGHDARGRLAASVGEGELADVPVCVHVDRLGDGDKEPRLGVRHADLFAPRMLNTREVSSFNA